MFNCSVTCTVVRGLITRQIEDEFVYTWPGPPFRKKEDVVDVLVTDEEDELLMEAEDVRPAHIELQHMIERGLQVFRKDYPEWPH